MRKPRAIIYDDDAMILELMKLYFARRGYEVFLYSSPVVCPFHKSPTDSCENPCPCADILISDFKMPGMTGIELLQGQSKLGCKLEMKFKAIMTGYSDNSVISQCADMGCKFFQKPVTFSQLSGWLSECEKLFDLSPQSGGKRINIRYECIQAIEYCLHPADNPEKLIGITVNKSNNGLGLRVFNPLPVGQNVTITRGLEVPPLQGTVMWCSKWSENMYRAGLHLINS
jgi:CheY-like chemotaxis protein